MSTSIMPHEFKHHAEGQPGGFLWRARARGATSFGLLRVNAEGVAYGDFLPLLWPGTALGGAGLKLAAEWPDGSIVLLMEKIESEEDLLNAIRESASDDDLGRAADGAKVVLVEDLPDWITNGTRKERRTAEFVKRLLPTDLAQADAAILQAFMAGFLYRGMMDAAGGDAVKGSVNRYRGVVDFALQEFGDASELDLLRRIGASEVKSSSMVEWQFPDGTVVDMKAWKSAVNAARTPEAKEMRARRREG